MANRRSRPWQVVEWTGPTKDRKKVLTTRATRIAARDFLNELPYGRRGGCFVVNGRTGEVDY